MDITTVCTLLINALKGAGYSTTKVPLGGSRYSARNMRLLSITMKSVSSMLMLWSAPKLESLARSVIIFKADL